MVLVKVVGRQNIFETGLTEDLLKPFWYFVKHHTTSRRNFVIPMLELVNTLASLFIYFFV